METSQAQALIHEIKKSCPVSLETGDYIARQFKRLPKLKSGQFAVRMIRTWGFEPRRFDRLIDYLADPWQIEAEGFTPALIAEALYRCGEIHEGGQWLPADPIWRRPPSLQESIHTAL